MQPSPHHLHTNPLQNHFFAGCLCARGLPFLPFPSLLLSEKPPSPLSIPDRGRCRRARDDYYFYATAFSSFSFSSISCPISPLLASSFKQKKTITGEYVDEKGGEEEGRRANYQKERNQQTRSHRSPLFSGEEEGEAKIRRRGVRQRHENGHNTWGTGQAW